MAAQQSGAVAGSPGFSKAAQQTADKETVLIRLPLDLPEQFRQLAPAHSDMTLSGEVGRQAEGIREVRLTAAFDSGAPTTTRESSALFQVIMIKRVVVGIIAGSLFPHLHTVTW